METRGEEHNKERRRRGMTEEEEEEKTEEEETKENEKKHRSIGWRWRKLAAMMSGAVREMTWGQVKER